MWMRRGGWSKLLTLLFLLASVKVLYKKNTFVSNFYNIKRRIIERKTRFLFNLFLTKVNNVFFFFIKKKKKYFLF